MLIIKTLLVIFLLMSFAPLQAAFVDTKKSLKIQLYQAIDANCDGVIDYHYVFNKPLSVLPQQCVIYKIEAQNISSKNLTNLMITGNIPLYTQLKAESISVDKEGKLRPMVVYQSPDSRKINTKLATLAPLKTITMFYSVMVLRH